MALTTHSQCSAEVRERLELYLWAFVACSRVNFAFIFQIALLWNEEIRLECGGFIEGATVIISAES